MPREFGRPNDGVRQQVQGGRDALAAGRDISVYYGSTPPSVTGNAPSGYPGSDAWIAAIHTSPGDYEPIGSGVVLDDVRILTCAHVAEASAVLWVSFPKADGDAAEARRQVERVVYPDARAPVKDLAILVLAGPVPAQVSPAPLRCPRPGDLVGRRWWAFGFSPEVPVGSAAGGEVGDALGHGWVRLRSDSSVGVVERGSSGGGLWCQDYQAVVAVVTHGGDPSGYGHAITLHQADQWFPSQGLRAMAERYAVADSGELALSAWGWVLGHDPERVRHWEPRARGVAVYSERGYRFQGRETVLDTVVHWLDRERPDRRALVVTGPPGAGKSAVLGRIVTTADQALRDSLPADDVAVRARVGSVACAVHAKDKTALEVAREVARAASAALPERLDDLMPSLRDVLGSRGDRRFNVIIDALDEAASPAESRLVMTKIVLPLAGTCADLGAQVVVGSRRGDGQGDLLEAYGPALQIIDLSDPEFFVLADLQAYAKATLQLSGSERADSPYQDEALAYSVACQIAALSCRNFLVAGLVAKSHGMYDSTPTDPAQLTFTANVDTALQDYLDRVPAVTGVPAKQILTALACADAPGLPVGLWAVAVNALTGRHVASQDLAQFARTSAANFLMQSHAGIPEPVFSLFHEALSETLLKARSGRSVVSASDQQTLTRAFIDSGRQSGWAAAPLYLLRSLAQHASYAGLLDDLLDDDDYLLHADLRRLVPLAGKTSSARGQDRARLLRLTPEALSADAPTRTALLSVTEALEGTRHSFRDTQRPAPYRAKWAVATPSTARAVIQCYVGRGQTLCAFTQGGHVFLATGCADGVLRIWDPVTGEQQRELGEKAASPIDALCLYTRNGQTLLAVAHGDRLMVWDPATGLCDHVPQSPRRARGDSLCAVTVEGQPMLAINDFILGVRIIDPVSGQEHQRLTSARSNHDLPMPPPVCAFTLRGQAMLAAPDGRGVVCVWDLVTKTLREHQLGDSHMPAMTLCALPLGEETLLAVGGLASGPGRVINATTGREQCVIQGGSVVWALCPVVQRGKTLLAGGCDDGMVRIWDPRTGYELRRLQGHDGSVSAVCAFTQNKQAYLASCGADGTVRIWDLASDTPHRRPRGHAGLINSACAFSLAEQSLAASADHDGTVRIWDPATGEERRTLTGHDGPVLSVCTFTMQGQALLASGGSDGTARIWGPQTGRQERMLIGHEKVGFYARDETGVCSVCAFLSPDGQALLATGGIDGTIRVWNPATGRQTHQLDARGHEINSLCTCATPGTRALLAYGTAGFGVGGMVGTWDPFTGRHHRALPPNRTSQRRWHFGPVMSVCSFIQDGQVFLASADGDNGVICIWDPVTGAPVAELRGYHGAVQSVCTISIPGSCQLLAVGGYNRIVQIWDPSTRRALITIPVHHVVHAVVQSGSYLLVGLSQGLLALEISQIREYIHTTD